jgi:hypothetical protein
MEQPALPRGMNPNCEGSKEAEESLRQLLSSGSLFILELVSEKWEYNFCAMSRVRIDCLSLRPYPNIFLS